MSAPTAKAAAKKTVSVARQLAAPALRSRAAAVPKTPAARKMSGVPANFDQMFEVAAETFRVMSAPMRLKIINALCQQEKNVSELLAEIDTTQPNMSQHLNTLFKAGILGRRREGVQIYYRIVNERVVTLCRAMCTQIALDSDLPHL